MPSTFLYLLAKNSRDRAQTDDIEAISTVVLSALAFESFLNDFFEIIDMMASPNEWTPDDFRMVSFIAGQMEKARASTIQKWEVTALLLSRKRIERGHQPYQDVDLLISLRNKLVHKKPEVVRRPSHTPRDEVREHPLVARLVGRGLVPPQSGQERGFFLGALRNPAVATWAVETVRIAGTTTIEWLPLVSSARAFFSGYFRERQSDQSTSE